MTCKAEQKLPKQNGMELAQLQPQTSRGILTFIQGNTVSESCKSEVYYLWLKSHAKKPKTNNMRGLEIRLPQTISPKHKDPNNPRHCALNGTHRQAKGQDRNLQVQAKGLARSRRRAFFEEAGSSCAPDAESEGDLDGSHHRMLKAKTIQNEITTKVIRQLLLFVTGHRSVVIPLFRPASCKSHSAKDHSA